MTTSPDTIIPRDPPIPVSYEIEYRFVLCRHCGHATRESTFYAVILLKSRFGTGNARRLVPCNAPQYNLPVTKVLRGTSTIPYCQACAEVDLSHLPPPPSRANVYDLPEPAAKQAAKPPGPSAPKKPTPPSKPSIFDLA